MYFDDAYVETPIYDRYRMGPGTQIDGPAIVEERESTTVVGPGADRARGRRRQPDRR